MTGISESFLQSGIPAPDMKGRPNMIREMKRATQRGQEAEQEKSIWDALNKAQEAQISLEAQEKAREEVWASQLEEDLKHDLENGAFVELPPENSYDSFLSRLFGSADNDDDPRLEAA